MRSPRNDPFMDCLIYDLFIYAVGGQTNPVWGRGGAPLECLHMGPLQPCYAADSGAVESQSYFLAEQKARRGLI